MKTTAELLAPAGDWESLRAAVANGADAVYFGLSAFNARARATNFTLEELPEVMKFLHLRNVRGFVAFNILVFSNELPDAAAFITAIANAGVDAVIVQDLGLVRLIRKMAPSLHIHASTQMTLTEPRGLQFIQKLGVERVVLARELSLAEITKITAATTMPVEVFVHGALCVAYSGQCLTSEALGGRSANRGQCAQACRLPYEMIVDGVQKPLGDKAYLLSPQDLAAYDHIKPLIDAGVISFKIEGRLKGGPYVAATTQTYRTAIDAALGHKLFKLERKAELELAQVFSRGFTPGFLKGNNHQKLVRGRFPKSRGIKLGKVVNISPRGIRLELAEAFADIVKPGDGVLFDLGKPQDQEPGGRIWGVTHIRNRLVELQFEADSIDVSLIPLGCEVWKTDDPALRKRLESSYAQDKPARREAVTATLSGVLGGAVTLQFRKGDAKGTAEWPGPLEQAQKRATTSDVIREQLGRLGDTPFELKAIAIELPDGVMLPKSVLNDLRRRAMAELMATCDTTRTHAVADADALKHLRLNLLPFIPQSEIPNPKLTVLCRTLEQLTAVLPLKPDRVYCDFEDLRRYKDAVHLAKAAGVPIGLATLRVQKPGEEGLLSIIAKANPDLVLVRNLAAIEFFREELPAATLVGDFSLNIANELTADLFLREGLQTLVPSFDLNWDQFAAMMKASDPRRFEPVIHQHMPMFHMEHCVFAAFLSTGKDHRDCGRPCDTHKVELKDRTGANFPVLPDTGCRNTVFNSVAQSAAEYIARMKTLGVERFRIDLLRETPAEVKTLVERYAKVIAGIDDGRSTWKQLQAINQLGVTRGTLQLA
ncbi:DUF3656 domain-containing protein [soil metagenome]